MSKRLLFSILCVGLLLLACDDTDQNVRLNKNSNTGILILSVTAPLVPHAGVTSHISLYNSAGNLVRQFKASSAGAAFIENQSDFASLDGRLYAESLPAGVYHLTQWSSGFPPRTAKRRDYSGKLSVKMIIKPGKILYGGNIHFKFSYSGTGKRRRIIQVAPQLLDKYQRDTALMRGKFKYLEKEPVLAR